ncbi:Gfo/Idh/MocA family protein, partial [Mixta calida]
MTVKIGVVGLGGIAQKAWLPVLARADAWTLVGGFSPNQQKAQQVCDSYRMRCYGHIDALAADCDAVFVHSSTASHYRVVRELLELGVDVCVDKPLAETLDEAEALVELAHRRGRKLMVGFNRRFAPRYQQLKAALHQPASIRMEKHRSDSVGPHDLRFTLLDDYLHVVDTALWLADGKVKLHHGYIQTTEAGEMLYGEHHFSVGNAQVTTSMHRRAGTQRESVSAIADGGVWQLDEMRDWR